MNKIIIAIIGIALVAGAFLAGKWLDNDSDAGKNDKVIEAIDHYYAMDRFIISIADENFTRYLVLDLNLSFPTSNQNIADAETYTPLFRNALVKQFANLKHQQVKSAFEDIEQVQQMLLLDFNSVLKGKSSLELNNVLITNVFIQ
ncbi:flagellar basal body-associated protein FliL [Pseudoalteromonas mariniglutinosa]|uniref:flagellar basal body-associated FliL family protein n=1 Tax=Pseudoalteromonas mariniglutinosa TaxID=206042 RepID=UPI00384DCC6D